MLKWAILPTTLYLITGIAGIAGIAFAAETPPQQWLTLSLQQAVQLSLEQNPALQADREKVVQSTQDVSFTKAQFFPKINAVATANRQKDAVNSAGGGPFDGRPYNKYAANLQLSQPIYVGGGLSAGLAVAERAKDISQRTLEADQRDLTIQVIDAFYTTMLNQRVLDILKQNQKVDEQTVTTTEHYYKIGRAQLVDVLQARTTLALLMPQITAAENQVKNAASQLLTLLHSNQAREVRLTGDIPYVPPEKVAALLDRKKALPEVLRAQALIEQSRAREKATLSAYNPQLSLVGSIGRNAFTQSDLLNDYSTQWTFGLNLTIPIFAGLSSIYQRHSLSSATRQLEYSQAELLDNLSLSQVEAQRNLKAATAVLKSSRQADELSRRSLTEAQKDFKYQTINYLQFLTSQQNHLNAESSYIRARFGYVDAVARYFQASGIPVSELVALLGQ